MPSHWVLHGHGAPSYTNVQYPFPVDPPHPPDENPTGDHRRTFTLPDSFDGAARVLLRFDGVESHYRVWLNDTVVGWSTGSRLATEFDVTSLLRPGSNEIRVRVHQWSAASYLEDQDQWWLPGIFRDVTLLARPTAPIDDVFVRAGWTASPGDVVSAGTAASGRPSTGTGTISVPTIDAVFPVHFAVPELGVDVTWASADDVAPITVEGVEPWSAELPRLYDATLTSGGGGAVGGSLDGETVSLRLGFRSVQIVGDRFLVNGERVVFHGVNRHETHPVRGRVFDEAHARADMALMKQSNVNAIRTSHYPPHPRVLDLADELGFWVVLECDLETHGFEFQGWLGNPSDDPAWEDAYLDRVARTVERDKNHASIVMWSLGNESGTGRNLAAMAQWVHARDPERPVHYEGDYTGEYTDVYSRMYPTLQETESIGGGPATPLLGCGPAEAARQRSKPFIHCEYVHAMGNGPGQIAEYEALVDRYPRLHGGFVWEWRDHGLLAHTDDGTPYHAYGGDFHEVVHDGNFVMDGLVLPDDTPHPGAGGVRGGRRAGPPVRLGHDGAGREPVPLGLHRGAAVLLDPLAERRRRGVRAARPPGSSRCGSPPRCRCPTRCWRQPGPMRAPSRRATSCGSTSSRSSPVRPPGRTPGTWWHAPRRSWRADRRRCHGPPVGAGTATVSGRRPSPHAVTSRRSGATTCPARGSSCGGRRRTTTVVPRRAGTRPRTRC
ncbi:glycoside hydrolase family 2 TIM barrel-domain containing protein [Curtobacterium sp. MCPF17_052]|uniref:glycoside hydrolase family 2 TIM barrel-domain containing protein n=1 Tax=Curtobacterium sp. MCPF17_052 TaxID=2175655 RepID=UPI0024E0036C|nr:glycoside hydrolase family 2 TIM barrel-domain containing protein [Curtobacterium sp. MCPF17_052]WIB11715.1 glycoside hydrolase family 2 TIM barrel-domain containing protein [Curtobacterium sp. MCPF17_052]